MSGGSYDYLCYKMEDAINTMKERFLCVLMPLGFYVLGYWFAWDWGIIISCGLMIGFGLAALRS